MDEAGLPELDVAAGTLVIGDLHLDVFAPRDVERFETWLAGVGRPPRLVILGDLFEFWFGRGQVADSRPVLDGLRALTEAGTAVDVVPGNRDFLLDRAFEQETGARVRARGFVGLTAAAGDAARVLFVHGDELCTLDRPYQRLRRVLRSGPVRALGTRLPAPAARAVATRIRKASRSAIERKPSPTLAQQPDACRELAERHRAGVVVCGHAHRFRDEPLPGGPRWLVVDAFGGSRDTLVVDAAGELQVRA